MKRIAMKIVLMVECAAILMGLILLCVTLFGGRDDNVFVLDLNDDETHTLSFEELCLLPGEEASYVVRMNGKRGVSCELLLSFAQLEDKGLAQYAFVRIEQGDKVVCDTPLSTALEGGQTALSLEFAKGRTEELKITYYMPAEVGNEAENTAAVFELNVTAINHEVDHG